MKKRLLSAFLALAMVFSVVSQIDVLAADGPSPLGNSGNNNTKFREFTADDNSADYVTTASVNGPTMKNVSITFNHGVPVSVTFDPNYGANDNIGAAYSLLICANLSYIDNEGYEGNEVGSYGNYKANQNGPIAGAMPMAWGKSATGIKRTATGTVLTFTKKTDFTSEWWTGNDGEEDNIPYNTFYDAELNEYKKTDFTEGGKKIPVKIAMTCGSMSYITTYDTEIPLDFDGDLIIQPVPATNTVRIDIDSIPAPAVKVAPATTVSGVTVDGAAATAGEVTWSANATSAPGGYPAAGTGTYTAKFDITAPDGVTFTEGQAFSITIDGATSARAVYKDANTASVTAVFPAKKQPNQSQQPHPQLL